MAILAVVFPSALLVVFDELIFMVSKHSKPINVVHGLGTCGSVVEYFSLSLPHHILHPTLHIEPTEHAPLMRFLII